ncbi:hypothetical protein [Streptomyces sp. PU-14G]|uniref:hypothetical protein n=1 Tax=Streptomyces sp. PU-14G TaxID=2800808 RepID=UPI0034DE7BB1
MTNSSCCEREQEDEEKKEAEPADSWGGAKMKVTPNIAKRRPGVTVLQRRSALVGAWGSACFFGIMGAVAALLGHDKSPMTDVLLMESAILAFARVSWRALGRARIELHRKELCVVGLANRYRVPLVSVGTLEVDHGLEIVTISGEIIPVLAFSGSLLDRGRTVRAAAAHIRRALPRNNAQGNGTPPVVRTIDFAWADLALLPFGLAAVPTLLGLF